MAPVPVVCQSCGTLFFANNIIAGGGGARVQFENVGYGPCPVCGQSGRVLDGVYEFVGDTVHMLATSDYSQDQLQRLLDFLLRAQKGDATPGEVAEAVERVAPALRDAAQRLLIPKDASAFYAMLAVLVAIVGTVLAQMDSGVSDKDVEKITRGVVEEVERAHPRPPPSVSRPGTKRPPPPPRKAQAQGRRKRRGH